MVFMKVLMCGDLGHGCRDCERFAMFDCEGICPQIAHQIPWTKLATNLIEVVLNIIKCVFAQGK